MSQSDHSSHVLLNKAGQSRQDGPVDSLDYRDEDTDKELEISSMCCGAVFLLVNVVILSIIDEKPLNLRILFGQSISPNTLTSIFSTLSKASITLPLAEGLSQLKWTYFRQRPQPVSHLQLFDEASRGPLGALKLVWQLNARALVAALGAITLVFTLAMDPLSQQLFSYPSRWVAVNDTSSISIGATFELPNMTTPNSLANAMYLGMYDSTTQTPAFNCSTGDCMWPSFDTLAVCNSCVDKTSELRLDHSYYNDSVTVKTGFESRYTTPRGITFRTNYTEIALGTHDFWTDTMFQLNVHFYESGTDVETPTSTFHSSPQTASARSDRSKRQIWTTPPPNPLGPNAELASILHLRYAGPTEQDFLEQWSDPTDDSIVITPWTEGQSTVDYHECTLSYCTESHNTSMLRSGRLQDPATARTTLDFNSSRASSEQGYETWALTSQPRSLSTVNFTKAFQDRTPGIFWINSRANQGFLDQINSTLNFSFGATSSRDNRGIIMSGDDPSAFPHLMDRVAASLTTALRSGPAMVPVAGRAVSSETYVHVTWPWLILPAFSVFCAAVFLILCVVFSWEEGEPLWKSSALALLFHGFGGWDGQELGYGSVGEMKRAAKGMNAVLRRDEKGGLGLLQD